MLNHYNEGVNETLIEQLQEVRDALKQQEKELEEQILEFEHLAEQERELVDNLRKNGCDEVPLRIWLFDHFAKRWA